MARDNIKDLKDRLLLASGAMAGAGLTAVTPSIDLGYDDPSQRAVDLPDCVIKTTVATAVTAKTTTFTVMDSADNITFAAVVGMPTFVITGASSLYPATTFRSKLPRTVRRYIRLSDTEEAGGGTGTDGTMELSLRF